MDKASLESEFFELLSYMVVSASNLLEEPARYGPLRLVEASSRLVEILDEMSLGSQRIISIQKKIEAGKHLAMGNKKVFKAYLESLVMHLVDEL